jgi:mRNA interferase RelE/StbE
MAWTVRYTTSAARAIRKLEPQIRRRVRRAIDDLLKQPDRGKPLQLSLKGFRSLRVGDFRIIYHVLQERVQILVVAVGHRRNVYDRLERRLR